MSEASSVADTLQRLHGEGTFHSTGAWTLDSARAQSAMPMFSAPESFLLKLVQCAHSAKSPTLQLRTQGRRLEAHFTSPALDQHEVQDMVTNLSKIVARASIQPAELLAAAVRAAREHKMERILWGCLGRDSGWGLVLENDKITLHEMRPSSSGVPEAFFAVDAPETQGSAFWKRHVPFAAELEAARQRCCFSSVPIYHNGKLWSPQFPQIGEAGQSVPWLCDRLYLEARSSQQLLCLPHGHEFSALVYDLGDRSPRPLGGKAVSYLQQWRGYQGTEYGGRDLWPKTTVPTCSISTVLDFSLLPANALLLKGLATGGWRSEKETHYVQSSSAMPLSEYGHPVAGGAPRSSLTARAVYRIPSQPKGVPSRLVLVQNGVCLEPLSARLLMSDLQIYIADALQATDLSGLKLVEDERFGLILEWIQLELMQLARELRKTLNDWKTQGLAKKWVIKVMEAQNLDVRDYEVFS
jgi:hypothetical protein